MSGSAFADQVPPDALVAMLLSQHPAYRNWQPQPVPEVWDRQLEDLDPQQLMALAARCLLALAPGD